MAQRPPEDAYAIHCCWEMESHRLIREVELKNGDTQFESMLEQWRGKSLEHPVILRVMEISPELHYPQKNVALASAVLRGADGWAVLDGERSRWYPREDMPGEYDNTVLMLHVGRTLLGFKEQPDRKKYLTKESPKRDPEQIVRAYEKFLAELSSGDPKQTKYLLSSGSPLNKYFDSYVDARATANGTPKTEAVIHTYDILLAAASSDDETLRNTAMDVFGPLGDHFDEYVNAIVATGQPAKVDRLITQVAPYWDHNLGYGKLGKGAFECGRHDLAETYFLKLRQAENWARGEDMSFLAEIWTKRGRNEEARSLLLDCLKRLLEESKSATGSDRQLFERWFQRHRTTYLRLFPDHPESELQKAGIPNTTRPSGR